MKKREPWFLVLFSSIFIVNAGYFWISVSRTLSEALLANRISYLGSVFLPLSMLMIKLAYIVIIKAKFITIKILNHLNK